MSYYAKELFVRGKTFPHRRPFLTRRLSLSAVTPAAVVCWLCISFCGCNAILSPINGVPAHRLPAQFFTPPKNNLVPIDVSRLRQEPPQDYLVDAGDILGIYIQGVLGTENEPPPVHFPQGDSDLPPAIGFPIPVRDDGTLALPLVDPIPVRGRTLRQVEQLIEDAYVIKRKILRRGEARIIVTVIREREIRVIVLRQDGEGLQAGANGLISTVQSTRSEVVKLKAYKNDILNALAASGGLPGLNAKNEVKVLRSTAEDAQRREAFIRGFYAQKRPDPCICLPPLPDDPAVLRIPLRLPPGQTPTFRPLDIILHEGDIVMVESREREVYYTGGLLPGGEHPLPRDYDLDVIGALALAGHGLQSPAQGGGGGGSGGGIFGSNGIGNIPPGSLFILRQTPCNGQIIIEVDLTRALNSPAARPLVQAGDTLILRHKASEEIVNFGIGTFFTFGIQELFRGGGGRSR